MNPAIIRARAVSRTGDPETAHRQFEELLVRGQLRLQPTSAFEQSVATLYNANAKFHSAARADRDRGHVVKAVGTSNPAMLFDTPSLRAATPRNNNPFPGGYTFVLRNDYMNDSAWIELGDLLFTLQRYDAAEHCFREVIEFVNPHNPVAYQGLGKALAREGREREALATLLNVQQKRPTPEITQLIEKIERDATDRLNQIPAGETNPSRALLRAKAHAVFGLRDGDIGAQHTKAARWYLYQAAKKDPANPEIAYYRGLCNEGVEGVLKLFDAARKNSTPHNPFQRRAFHRITEAETAQACAAPPIDVAYIVALYNENPYHVDQCLTSILNQEGHHRVGAIVIDDGSTTGATADSIRKRYAREISDGSVVVVSEENRGAGGAFARGLKIGKARGARYFSVTGGSDAILPDKTTSQIDYLQAHPTVGIVHAQSRTTDEHGRPFPESGAARYHTYNLQRFRTGQVNPCSPMELEGAPIIHGGTTLMTKKAIDAAGYFSRLWPRGQDWQFWKELARSGTELGFMDKDVYVYRRNRTTG
ncbi:MAG: glycosyltransferase [Candidatus Woesearchaeota archaeon]|nr:glycosyltransferase [Candidatus Woesearchaeota archaeon]